MNVYSHGCPQQDNPARMRLGFFLHDAENEESNYFVRADFNIYR